MAATSRSTTHPHVRSRRSVHRSVSVRTIWFVAGHVKGDPFDVLTDRFVVHESARPYMRGLLSRLHGQLRGQRSRPRTRGATAGLTRADALEIFALLRQLDMMARLIKDKRYSRQVRVEAKEVRRHLLEDPASPVSRARARG